MVSPKLLSMHTASARVYKWRSAITIDERRSHELPRHMPRIRIGIQRHHDSSLFMVVGTQLREHHEARAARPLGSALQKCHSHMYAASQSVTTLTAAGEDQRAGYFGERLAGWRAATLD